MNILETNKDGAVVRVRVEIPSEEISPKIEEAFQIARKSVQIDGFRPGKVPMNLIRKRYGASIKAEAVDAYIKEIYPSILEEAGLRPLVPGDILEPDLTEDEGLHFTVLVEVMPDIELGNWREASIAQDMADISDEDVEQHIGFLQKEKAIISERPDDEGVENGDRLTVNVQELDTSGVPVIGNKQDGAVFEVGENALGHDTDDQLIGVKKDEECRVNTHRHKFNDKGEQIEENFIWSVTITKIEKIELPELDDNFAAELNPEFNTMDDLRTDVRRRLENMGKYYSNQTLAQRMIDKLVEMHTFPLPPTLLTETIERMVDSRRKEMPEGIKDEQLRAMVASMAEKQLKWYFLQKKLIEDLQLEASEEEVDDEIKKQAAYSGQDLESLKLVFKSGEQRDQLKDEIVESKLMEELHNNMKIEERKVPFGELIR